MKRILHITGGMNRAGAETMIMNLYREIDKNKYQFDFVYFTSEPCDYDDEIIELGGRIHRLRSTNFLSRFFDLKRLLIKHTEYRVVQSHTLLSSAFHLSAAAFAGVPYRIAHSHNTSDLSKSKFITLLYHSFSRSVIKKYATNFIACGKAASRFLFQNEQKVLFLPNAIDTTKFASIGETQKEYINSKFQVEDDCLKIIQVGRLQAVKNPFYSIEIAKLLKERGTKFKLFFVGQGDLREELEEAIKVNSLVNEVVLLGVRSDIPELMAGSDVMLMPSLHEGFPVVLVEAQSVGLPALISNTISHEVNLNLGLVDFEELSVSASMWADQLVFVKSRKNMKTTERLELLKDQGFDIKSSTKRLINMYNKLC
jgi:glycosyltransferase EpsF